MAKHFTLSIDEREALKELGFMLVLISAELVPAKTDQLLTEAFDRMTALL